MAPPEPLAPRLRHQPCRIFTVLRVMRARRGLPLTARQQLLQHGSVEHVRLVGSYVCIERKGTPWRVATLAGLDEVRATTENGYVNNRRTGKRLVQEVPSRDELRPLTRDRVDSSIVREFLDLAARLSTPLAPTNRLSSWCHWLIRSSRRPRRSTACGANAADLWHKTRSRRCRDGVAVGCLSAG
jgi:hypothetical protein